MTQNKSRVKTYEQLITKALNSSSPSGVENHGPPAKKKRLKKRTTNQTSNNELTRLELIIGIYHFLTLDARKYANKWNFSSLISILEVDPVVEKSLDLGDAQLVRWFVVKISALLLNLTPAQENELFRVYFKSDSVLNECSLR